MEKFAGIIAGTQARPAKARCRPVLMNMKSGSAIASWRWLAVHGARRALLRSGRSRCPAPGAGQGSPAHARPPRIPCRRCRRTRAAPCRRGWRSRAPRSHCWRSRAPHSSCSPRRFARWRHRRPSAARVGAAAAAASTPETTIRQISFIRAILARSIEALCLRHVPTVATCLRLTTPARRGAAGGCPFAASAPGAEWLTFRASAGPAGAPAPPATCGAKLLVALLINPLGFAPQIRSGSSAG